jgi:hypothetical protein
MAMIRFKRARHVNEKQGDTQVFGFFPSEDTVVLNTDLIEAVELIEQDEFSTVYAHFYGKISRVRTKSGGLFIIMAIPEDFQEETR